MTMCVVASGEESYPRQRHVECLTLPCRPRPLVFRRHRWEHRCLLLS